MNRSQHKLIYEFSGSRNLNTSPLDVTGLDGDSWDYMVEIVSNSHLTSSASINIRFNNDSSSNYRKYGMYGQGSSTGAGSSDTRTEVSSEFYANGSSCYSRFFITGDSSVERYVDSIHSADSGVTFVQKNSHYWKDNSNNLNSIQFVGNTSTTYDITLRIYQVPKQANLQNYDLVEVVEFSGRDLNTNPIEFSGLDGDSDGEYLVESFTETDEDVNLRINNDSTSNYVHQHLYNSGGSIGAENITRTGATPETQANILFRSVKAVSGRKRLITQSASRIASSRQQGETGVWWGNTANNITELRLYSPSVTSCNGYAKLYKRKSNRTIDPVPMMTVVEHDINGVDFSAGITITGIEGDRIDVIKVEYIGEGSTQLRIQPNVDTGSNYTSQRLVGITSSVVAVTNSLQYLYFCEDGATTNEAEMYIYPTSGQNRPVLSRYSAQENRVDLRGQWWNNSVNEITSMKIYASNTNAVTGTIRISIPVGTKQATNSWIKTVN